MKITITSKANEQTEMSGVTMMSYKKGGVLQVYTGGTLPQWEGDFKSFDLVDDTPKKSRLVELPDIKQAKRFK